MPEVIQALDAAIPTTAALDDALLARAEQLWGIWNVAPCSRKPPEPWCNGREPGAWQHSAAVNPHWSRFPVARGRRDPLLASAKLSHTKLWTQDQRLAAIARERELAVAEPEAE